MNPSAKTGRIFLFLNPLLIWNGANGFILGIEILNYSILYSLIKVDFLK